MLLVINEWLFHDLWGENGPERQEQAAFFLSRLRSNDDRIVFLRGSSWAFKADELWKHGDDPAIRILCEWLHALLWDQDKCVALDGHELAPLPTQLADIVPDEDAYLVQVYLAANADVLVTDDGGLHAALLDSPDVQVQMRAPFLEIYLP